MRVLVQILDRYGDSPAQTEVVFLNDGPVSFKKGKKVDMDLVNHCLSEAYPEMFEGEIPVQGWDGDNIQMDDDGNTVHISMEETDYLLTSIEPYLQD